MQETQEQIGLRGEMRYKNILIAIACLFSFACQGPYHPRSRGDCEAHNGSWEVTVVINSGGIGIPIYNCVGWQTQPGDEQ